MYQKNTNIELGRESKGATFKGYLQNLVKTTYPNTQSHQNYDKSKVVAKQVIVSTHKIPGKVSPAKYKIYSHQTSRNGSVLDNENSFIEHKDLSISTPTVTNQMVRIKSPLRDTSNLSPSNSPSRQFIRVNFMNNSPTCSRTSSNLMEFRPSPSKMITCNSSAAQTREQGLQRKLKVLEGRIGELHKEKHEIVGKLNQENRKIYHENTTLKLKINDLTKYFQKSTPNQSSSGFRTQIQAMKEQIKKFEQIIGSLNQKNEILSQQMNLLVSELKQSNQKLSLFVQQNKNLGNSRQQKVEEYNSLHCQYLQISEQKLCLISQKQKYEQDLQEIQQSICQNNKSNAMIIQEYVGKLDQYKQAYDRNQQIIEQLSQQLQLTQKQSSNDIYPSSDEIGESEGELAMQCKNLQNNFLMALEEKDQLIESLSVKNKDLKSQLVSKNQIIDELNRNNGELNAINGEQACKLEEVCAILDRYTQKMKEMEKKYEQLWQKHEEEKQKGSKSLSSSFTIQKCKKCEELTKTIFRLNSHLNKRN